MIVLYESRQSGFRFGRVWIEWIEVRASNLHLDWVRSKTLTGYYAIRDHWRNENTIVKRCTFRCENQNQTPCILRAKPKNTNSIMRIPDFRVKTVSYTFRLCLTVSHWPFSDQRSLFRPKWKICPSNIPRELAELVELWTNLSFDLCKQCLQWARNQICLNQSADT